MGKDFKKYKRENKGMVLTNSDKIPIMKKEG